jgi:hypothetical protein
MKGQSKVNSQSITFGGCSLSGFTTGYFEIETLTPQY